MSAEKTSEASELDDDAKETEAVPQAELQPRAEAENPPKVEAQAQPEAKPVRAKTRAEAEPKPVAKPPATKSIAEIMRFDLRTRGRPRR